MINRKNYKLLSLATFSFIITTTLFQNCSPVKLGKNADQASSNFSEGISYAPKSVSGAQVITNGNVVLKEYRHKASNRFFYTARVNDQSLLDTTYASLFEVTGNTITVKAAIDAGLSPVYRLFNKAGFHLYTAEINERTTSLTDVKFQDEGIEGYAIKINPNSSCPTSPSVTYPVYRLSHNGSYKYRLVTDSALKSQLLTLGYSDEGVLFCATAVSSTPAAGGTASCNFGSTTLAHGATATGYSSATAPCNSQLVTCNNGNLSNPSFNFNSCTAAVVTPPAGSGGGACSWTWADDFSSTAPINRPRPATACTSANSGQKQNGVAGAADWACMCDPGAVTPPVVIGGTASCNFGSTTLAHGATATGFSSATEPCASQQVTCTNGVLSNTSYSFNACSPAAPDAAAGADLCPSLPVNVTLNAAKNYQMYYTGDYEQYAGKLNYNPVMRAGSQFIIKLNVAAADTTVGRYPASFEFSDIGPSRAGRYVTISRSKCDYSATAQWISPNPFLAPQFLGGVSANASDPILINDPRVTLPSGSYLKIETGVWYINIKNVPGGCPSNVICDVLGRWAN